MAGGFGCERMFLINLDLEIINKARIVVVNSFFFKNFNENFISKIPKIDLYRFNPNSIFNYFLPRNYLILFYGCKSLLHLLSL